MKYGLLVLFILLVIPCEIYAAGCISGDCFNGKGTGEWTSGDKYTGDWKDHKKNGYGTLEIRWTPESRQKPAEFKLHMELL